MKTPLAVSLAISSVLFLGVHATDLSETLGKDRRHAGLDAHETHASMSLLGQARTNISSWLWLKSDLYLHNGVEMRPLTDEEKRKGVAAQTAANDGHEQLFSESDVTVVPSKRDDFRGSFGDVERATATYKDMREHHHNDPAAAMPLFKLMTWVDPEFVQGWTTGATIIARKPDTRSTFEALNFLNDGLKANPSSVEMLVEIGYLHLTRRKDLKTAAAYFERARFAGRTHSKELDDEERDALEQAYRWLALCYRDLGDHKALHEVADEGLRTFPDDEVLSKTIDAPPLMLTDLGERLWLEKVRKEAGLTTEAHIKKE